MLPSIHGLHILQDRGDKAKIIRAQPPEAQAVGLDLIMLNFFHLKSSHENGAALAAPSFCFFYLVPKIRSPASPRPGTI